MFLRVVNFSGYFRRIHVVWKHKMDKTKAEKKCIRNKRTADHRGIYTRMTVLALIKPPISWNTSLFEKLMVTQLFKKFPTFMEQEGSLQC